MVGSACAEPAPTKDKNPTPMVLDLFGDSKITAPSDEQIKSGLATLDENTNAAFAVLGTNQMTYIQVSGDKATGFTLEYQEGNTESHFKAKGEPIPFEKVVKAFIKYRDSDPSWKKDFVFEKITWKK
jgi:hypothetical protein